MSENGRTDDDTRRMSSGTGTRRVRGLLGGGLGFATLAALLVLAAPLSSAHGTVSFTAPYTGFTTSTSAFVNHTGCGFATNAVPASFTPSSGAFQFSAAAGAGTCSRGGEGYADASTTLTSPLFASPTNYNGTGYVYVALNTSFSAKAALHLGGTTGGNGTSGGGFAQVVLYAEVLVYDATHHNDSLVGYTSLDLVDQYFSSASGQFSLTQGWTTSYLYVSASFTGGHVYQLEMFVGADLFAETYGGGSTAQASINAGGTNGLVIESITAY
jgi:hypothetical protein